MPLQLPNPGDAVKMWRVYEMMRAQRTSLLSQIQSGAVTFDTSTSKTSADVKFSIEFPEGTTPSVVIEATTSQNGAGPIYQTAVSGISRNGFTAWAKRDSGSGPTTFQWIAIA